MSGRQLIKLLQEKGWHPDRVEGSHHILVKGNKTLSVPVHSSKDLGKGLLHALILEKSRYQESPFSKNVKPQLLAGLEMPGPKIVL
jgi:predicted RNA binding protein YcfA (HicA-like mRNA interferase family)